MGKILSVEPKTIGEVFIEPKHFFEIPRFQRPYSWEEGNIEEFWDTIFASEPVFLGTIILNNKRLDDDDVVEIIDGQQRYLTIQILGAVMRDMCYVLEQEFEDSEFSDIGKGIAQSLIGKPDKWNNSKLDYYLTPGESIKPFFTKHIQSSVNTIDETLLVKKKSEEERVKEAYLRFKELLGSVLQDLNLEEKKTLLKELVDKRLGKHLFARIVIDDEDLAYEIFETVNAKGVDLNVADLIKNQIFRHVINGDERYTDSAKERWQTVIDNVDASGLTIKDFLSYYWSSKYGYVPDRRLYRAIRDHFRENSRWNEFLDDLVLNSSLIRTIFIGTLEDLEALAGDPTEANRIFKSLRVLRNTKAKTWSILYLCIFRNILNSEDASAGSIRFQLGKRWELIAKFTFVYYEVLNLGGNWYFKETWNFCKKIEEYSSKKKSNKEFSELFRNNLFTQFETKLPKREHFTDGFQAISYKETKKARVIIRYVLSELEADLAGQFDVGFDETKVSIEHILPQTPDEWACTKKEVKNHVNLIGNLVLISKRLNASLGKRPLEDKLVELQEKSKQMYLVQQLLDRAKDKQWDFSAIANAKDFAAIEKRGLFLAEHGYKIWVEELRKKMGF